ncbi:aminoacyl tRNA synthase complex-interacting multifunctional protein 2 isoform X2 [Ixodes scapularis]
MAAVASAASAVEHARCHMYRVEPIYGETGPIELPNCMYKVDSVYCEADTSGISRPEMQAGADAELVQRLEARQEQLLKKLESLHSVVQKTRESLSIGMEKGTPSTRQISASSVSALMQSSSSTAPGGAPPLDVVLGASPGRPPFSVWPLKRLLGERRRVLLSCHTHSSVSGLPQRIGDLGRLEAGGIGDSRSFYDLVLTLVWKQVERDCEMMVNPLLQVAISGEVNLIRYLGRLLDPSYESLGPVEATEVDHWLDQAHHGLLHGKNKERQAVLKALNAQLGNSPYVLGSSPSLADIALWSAVLQLDLLSGAPSNVKRWMKTLNEDPKFKLPESCLVPEVI